MTGESKPEPSGADDSIRTGVAFFSRGVDALQANQPDEAIGLLKTAISIRRARPLYYFKLGQALVATERFDEAAEAFAQSVRLNPDLAPAYMALSRLERQRGNASHATAHLKEALRLVRANFFERILLAPRRLWIRVLCLAKYSRRSPNQVAAQVQCYLGKIWEDRGKLDRATFRYQKALGADPDCVDALIAMGRVSDRKTAYDMAATHLEKALELEPDRVEALAVLGPALAWLGRIDEAVAMCERCLALAPNWAQSHCAMGRVLDLKGDSAAAVSAFEQAISIEPRQAETHYLLGAVLEALGRPNEAVEQNREALAIEPGHSQALWSLAINTKIEPGDPLFDELEQALARPGLVTSDRLNLHFAAGKMFDDIDARDQAFAYYSLANDLMDAEFDAEENAAEITALIEAIDAGFFERTKGFGLTSELPVFIVGMPRSGTTLVEQILASHPDAFGAGELMDIGVLSERIGEPCETPEPYSKRLAKIDESTVRALAQEYLDKLRSYSPDAARISDKLPANFVRLGMIAVMFPRARVIHCVRNPLDTCLSNYFMRFSAGPSYSWDLINLGHYYNDYVRLMDHWRRVLPLPILEVRYEDLVADQKRHSQRLIDFCGLPWDERCLAFYKSKRVVRTASRRQVRQPIYTSSVERWRRYEAHLVPLIDILKTKGAENDD